MEKRGQVTIFIIIAVVVVAVVAIVFFFMRGSSGSIGGSEEISSEAIFKDCLGDDLNKIITTLSYQGGNMNPELAIKFKFGDENYKNITYLCYSRDYYTKCINQQPVLINHVKEEIRNEMEDKIEKCFMDVVNTAKKDFDVDYKYDGFEIDVVPEHTDIIIDGDIIYKKGDETFNDKNFKIKFKTEFYDLLMLAQEISSQESNFCYFDRVGYMLYNPSIEIDAPFKIDDTKIYTLRHTKSKEIFRFAIRTCAIPEGLM